MAVASAPTNEMKGFKLSNPCTPGKSMESEYHTAVVCGSELGTTSSYIAGSGSVMARAESEKRTCSSEQEEQFERSKVHWNELSELAIDPDEEAAEIDNREVFKTLQMHSIAPKFFCTFGYDLGVEGRRNSGELEMGEKFAEGGQAELFHVKVTWSNPKKNESDRKEGREWLLKVFKKGTLLRHLQSQWPQEYLQFRVKLSERYKLGKPPCFR